jgi:branched-chain amino acid transport system permease protein
LQQLINVAVLGSVYALFALGVGLPWGTLNVLNLAHGSVFLFAGFVSYWIAVRDGISLSLPEALLLGIVAGAALELALEWIVFRQIRRRSHNEHDAQLLMLIGSVGASGLVLAVVDHVTGGSTFSVLRSPAQGGVHHWLGAVVTNLEIWIVILGVVVSAGVAVWLRKTMMGRALRALAVDPETTSLMGVSRLRLSTLVLLLSGGTAGLAGILLGEYLVGLQSTSGQDLLLKGFAVVVLGGVGSVWGSLVGAFVLAGGEVLVTATTSGVWTDAVSFGLIVVILLIRPNGLFGSLRVDRA